MTEQPDTAELRAMLWNGLDVETALELCDALDAARAERDEYLAHCHKVNGRLEEWIDIAEAAEARIAAALEEHEPRPTYGTGPADSLHPDDRMCRLCKAVYPCATARALTEGAGQ